jgi:hypothetical protein
MYSYPTYISPNERYNFKVSLDQFGRSVPQTYFDITELTLIKKFEDIVLNLVKTDKIQLTMVELGSNQAYYTLLFKAICKQKNRYNLTLCVEPNRTHLFRTNVHLEMNEYSSHVVDVIVGDFDNIKKDLDESTLPGGSEFLLTNKRPIMSLEKLIQLYRLGELDILQCDVDHSEWSVLKSSEELFKNKQVKHIFLGTHSEKLHDRCKKFLLECGYKLKFEERNMVIGYDSLLIFEA